MAGRGTQAWSRTVVAHVRRYPIGEASDGKVAVFISGFRSGLALYPCAPPGEAFNRGGSCELVQRSRIRPIKVDIP
jgi:hypothetical protein